MSPSPSEKKALLFLAGVLFLGGVMRATGAARRVEHADAASREALRRQIVAAESAAAVERRERSARGERRSGRATRGRTSGSGAGVGAGVSGDAAGPGAAGRTAVFDAPAPLAPLDRVDVDRASAEELERLPRIGSALAARIVDDRERNGPYGSLEALQRVRGIGPAMARQLASTVTFSGTPRPSNAGEASVSRSMEGATRRRRQQAARAYPPP
jgi:competence protein ComEA